jgi:MFS family permease
MHLVYAGTAYPFGVLADHIDRRLQLGMGTFVLIGASAILAAADTMLMTMLGAGLWGLQMALTQGLLSASVADAAPDNLRGTAFGIYELAVGVATFIASTAAGMLWTAGGPELTFGCSAVVAAGALLALLRHQMGHIGPIKTSRSMGSPL